MNFKTLASASLFAVLSLGAVAANATSAAPASNAGVMQYHYGDHLDVKRVLSVKDDQPDACGVVNTRMDYLDSRGQHESVDYLTYSSAGCHDH
ncbi:DUF2790 domain-containing protein [Pantoea sp. Tr-811]|uniref:DUF2790 domain-containing protein n=1 Tax=unclassified Pantoea TaxID=2630326 RepID=UPI001420753F|nr:MULTISPECIES: DUF2790 domain-containing protein [unclassified Pantoea]NIE73143.1 DUF2790 domain-containing protein [Pantoea sp. Ap-967]NIF28479.1 DUF2790 domain-containing protein [Pantoea sp. Tr-811]